MEFDVKTILLLINGLLLPCILWVWRVSTAQRLHQSNIGVMRDEYAKQFADINRRIAEMPTHKTIHSIEKSLIKIDGSLKVVATEISHIKENNRSFEEALNIVDARTRKGGKNA